MKVSILIVTFSKDFPWLRHCLKSIAKFATGFHEVVVAIPAHESALDVWQMTRDYDGRVPLRFYTFDEWPGKGFLHHAALICRADELCPDADFILHMDADCVFVEAVAPEDYFVDGKPVLIGARYDWIVKQFNNENHYRWQEAVEMAIGLKPEQEHMRRHPAVHPRQTYSYTRALVEQHTGKKFDDYVRSTKNDFPQTFAEFPLLGAAGKEAFSGSYHWLNQEHDPWPHDKLYQFWSHSPPSKPNNVWIGGRLHTIVPDQLFTKLGI